MASVCSAHQCASNTHLNIDFYSQSDTMKLDTLLALRLDHVHLLGLLHVVVPGVEHQLLHYRLD